MDQQELSGIVEQRMDDPAIIGRLACNLRSDVAVSQNHRDGRNFEVSWRNAGGWWRCTVFFDKEDDRCLAQIDLHNDGTIRIELWEPCSVTVSPEDGILCLTRYVSVKADS